MRKQKHMIKQITASPELGEGQRTHRGLLVGQRGAHEESRDGVWEERLSLTLVMVNLRCQPNKKAKVSGGELGISIIMSLFEV